MGKPSPLASALAEVPSRSHRCPFARFVEEHPERAAIEQALAAIIEHRRQAGKSPHGPTATWLANVLAENGEGVWASDKISDHIAGRCRCRG